MIVEAGDTMSKEADERDQFSLHDLEVVVESIEGNCTCDMSVGNSFQLRGGKLAIPGGSYCLYALQSAIPLLPAKQRVNHPADWIETDSRICCPDPACQLVMRIDRVGKTNFKHDDVSATRWTDLEGASEKTS